MADVFRVGVVIIGSLSWDNDKRERWRQDRLVMGNAEFVRLPIRYGRVSENRGNTHTMVFSRLCYRHRGLGIGLAVPFCRVTRSWDDLRTEVEQLATAEGLRGDDRQKWKKWGVVGLLANPSTSLPEFLVQPWKEYFVAHCRASAIFDMHTKSEGAIIDKQGFLKVRWPVLISGRHCGLDLLLGTPTTPTLTRDRRYAGARTIAEAYCRADCPDYFLNNIKVGIRTFQDLAIARWLARQRPEWAEKLRERLQPQP